MYEMSTQRKLKEKKDKEKEIVGDREKHQNWSVLAARLMR